VPGTVDVGVVPTGGLVLDVRGADGDAAGALLGRLVDGAVVDEGVEGAARDGVGLRQDLGDRRRKRGLAVVDVADGADVDVGLAVTGGGVGGEGAPTEAGDESGAGGSAEDWWRRTC